MNEKRLEEAIVVQRKIRGLAEASKHVDNMRKCDDKPLDLTFFEAAIGPVARRHILVLAQADIDAQLRDAKAAFEAL